MALRSWRVYALGVGIVGGLASLLCWLAAQDSYQQPLLWQPRAQQPDAPAPPGPQQQGDGQPRAQPDAPAPAGPQKQGDGQPRAPPDAPAPAGLRKEPAAEAPTEQPPKAERQPRAVPASPRKEPGSVGDLLEDMERPRPDQESSLDGTEPDGAGSPSRVPAAAAADLSRQPHSEPPHSVAEPHSVAGANVSRPPTAQQQATTSPLAHVQTSPPIQVRTPPTRAPPPLNCNTQCQYQGFSGTCRQRIQWLADHEYPGMQQACWLAHSKVRAECPSCSGCDLLLSGCTVPCEHSCLLGGRSASCKAHVQQMASISPAGPVDTCRAATAYVSTACPSCSNCRPAATGCVLPCERQCTMRSVTAYCRSHIQWLADHDFSERPDACDAAHQRVMSECPSCGSCTLQDASCKVIGNSTVQKKLLQGIYGIRAPSPLKKLPSCAKKLRVYVYDISSTFNTDLIAAMHKRRNHSNCDYELTQCFEKHWDADYSVMRSCAGEVPLLYKFLSMPRLTDDADKADLFVVPWFGALSKIVMGQPWGGGDGLAHRVTREVFTQLPHMRDPEKARRHVFFSSIDHDDVDTTLLYQARAGALLLHYGPSAGPDEIVAVPSGAGFGAPLEPLLHPAPNFLFYMAGAVNVFRRRMDSEVTRLKTIRPDLQIVHSEVVWHRKLGLTPAETQQAMSRSLLCPIAQGDLPFQHRFFDALVSGCIPVVVRYSEAGMCDNWSWIWTEGSWGKWPRPCVNSTYPLPSSVRYEDIVVQIPAAKFQEGHFAEVLAGLDMAELEQKRRRLERLRHLFVYDRTGETYDAFSGTLQEICKAIGAG